MVVLGEMIDGPGAAVLTADGSSTARLRPALSSPPDDEQAAETPSIPAVNQRVRRPTDSGVPNAARLYLAPATGVQTVPVASRMQPKEVVEQLYRRLSAGDREVDDLVAADMENHAAGAQGRQGLLEILEAIAHDLGDDVEAEHHHLIAEGELVAHHMTLRGTHRASTMPLLSGTEPTGMDVGWTFIHIWRVIDGVIVEHWACRDDLGLLAQIGAWPPAATAREA